MAIVSALALLAALQGAFAADSPGKLRSEMVKVEREFINLYNKANTNPEFAILCRMDTPTGTSFAVRVCQPRYLIASNAKTASELIQSAVAATTLTGPANANGPNVGATFDGNGGAVAPDKDEAFKQNLLGLLRKSPELQALGKKRDDLQTRFNEATKGKGGS
jgi:hypothetical protein